MNYLELLQKSAEAAGNCACVGLDIIPETLPAGVSVDRFIKVFLTAMKKHGLCPAAFKPNIAYFAALNQAYTGKFSGYRSLTKAMHLIRNLFPNVPIILDAKRGDIATSSQRYACEVFNSWQADAATISGYMGSDSILPFRENFETKGVYILARTSNNGAKDFQDLHMQTQAGTEHLYEHVAAHIAVYAREYPGTGAVVGATNIAELSKLAVRFAQTKQVPLLIPGVGSQGGSATDVIHCLKSAGYDLHLVRINSSSGLTAPWKKEKTVPSNWLDACMQSVEKFLAETKI